MAEKKFIITRASAESSGVAKRLVVSDEIYQMVSEWAEISGKPMSQIANRAIAFAASCAVIVDE